MTPKSNQMIFCVFIFFNKGTNIKYSCSLKKIRYYSHTKIEHLKELTFHAEYDISEEFVEGYYPQQHVQAMTSLKHYLENEICGKRPIPIIFINDIDKIYFTMLLLLFGIDLKGIYLDNWSAISDDPVIIDHLYNNYYPMLKDKYRSELLAELANLICKASVKTYKMLHEYAAEHDNILEFGNYISTKNSDNKSKV